MYERPIKLSVDSTLGYEYFMDKKHPLANSIGRVWYHRHVASLREGRWVTSSEVVHHIDHDKLNNSLENLGIMSRSAHGKLHRPPEHHIVCAQCGCAAEGADKSKYCSPKCAQLASRRTPRPSKDELRELIDSSTWTAIGKHYGVSDNAVRKWARSYGLLQGAEDESRTRDHGVEARCSTG